jgi:hypothetical protein
MRGNEADVTDVALLDVLERPDRFDKEGSWDKPLNNFTQSSSFAGSHMSSASITTSLKLYIERRKAVAPSRVVTLNSSRVM